MRFTRYLTMLVSGALLGLPVLVVGAAPASATEYAVDTTVTIKLSDSSTTFQDRFSVTGAITYTTPTGQRAALGNQQTLILERKLAGTKVWRVLAKTNTANSYYFYPVTSPQNASYRVRFAGGTFSNGTDNYRYKASRSADRWQRVSRRITDRGVQRGGLAIKGRVAPSYARKVVLVQRKTCTNCAWKTYSRVRTNGRSQFSAPVKAPRNGSWLYRVKLANTTRFFISYGGTYRAYSF